MLERLQLGPASITGLARLGGMSLPGMLKHVRVLEEARLVSTEKKGRTRECRLGPDRMDDVTGVDRAAANGRRAPTRPARVGPREAERRTAVIYDLKIERILDAPPDLVFDTIVDPAFKDEIFADLVEGWAPLRFDIDLRVGGFETEADRDSFDGEMPTWLDSVQRVVEASAAAAPEEGT